MKVLFIHQNFPGQFIHLSAELAKDSKNQVVALGMNDRPVPQNVEFRRYNFLRSPNPDSHPLLQDQESHVLRAEACAAAAFQLKRDGFVPDLIVAHPGWGEALFIKDVFPAAKLIIYCEYFYALEGQDVGFDPEVPPLNFQQQARLRLKNTTNLHSLQIADAAFSPTLWQKSTYPAWAHSRISVIHDGINTQHLRFNPAAALTLNLPRGPMQLTPGHEVLTFVARNLEPVRGFHVLMRTLPAILESRPNAHAIIIGGDEVSYGHRAPTGQDWKTYMLNEVGNHLDMSRVHFLGKVPYQTFLDVLSISRVHAYWTTPFVLSWSFLQAALSGVAVVASATKPVLEFSDRLQVATSDFFDRKRFASLLAERLRTPQRPHVGLHIPELELHKCVEQQLQLISSVL